MVTALLLVSMLGADSQTVEMKFTPSGATAKVGGYRPIRAALRDTSDGVKQAPAGLVAAKYGELRLGDERWGLILDEPEGKPASLFVDTNGDGDYTNDPPANWKSRKTNGLTMYNGSAQIDLGDDRRGQINLYRFDPNDPRRAQLKNTLLFYTDFGYELTFRLDDESFTTFVAGDLQPNSRLWVDRDQNGRRSSKREMISVGKPFNFTGTTYVLSTGKDGPSLAQATENLPVMPLPPDLSIGKTAPEFKMATLDRGVVAFPQSYAGRIVMLDFWATWCGPCIAELPNVKKAYEDWHDKGFDILGISFDREGMEEKLAQFLEKHDMPWQQIYEGKGWNTSLGETYDVSGIPFVLLVDGDSGQILATSRQLRGPGLSDFIGKTLDEKKGE